METTASFGYWIRRQRKALDLTQQALADRVGCSLAAIKKIEGDEREVDDLGTNMDEADFKRAWAKVRAMSMEQAIRIATENGDSQQSIVEWVSS